MTDTYFQLVDIRCTIKNKAYFLMTPFLISWEIQLGELGQYSDGCRLVKWDLIALGQELFSSLLHEAWLCGPPRLVKLEITLFP